LPNDSFPPQQPDHSAKAFTIEQRARLCADLAAERRAEDIVILDLRNLSAVADFFVIASANADIQVRSAADRIKDGMKEAGHPVWRREGFENGHWIILDYVDIVCHIFLQEKRDFYQLDRLWGDAPRITLTT
jgi:ribosome-associated protein